MKRFGRLAVLAVFAAVPAQARDFCPDRPGMDIPPCTVEPGRVSAEVSFLDWTHDASADGVTDTFLAADSVVRWGIADHAEVHVGWTAFGHERQRQGGGVERQSGTGDLTLAIKRNLANPDGKGLSIALLPSVTLPTGGRAIGAGDWAVGLLVPVSASLTDKVSLMLTPEIDAATDEDRHGRHLAYGTTGGLSLALTDHFNLAVEASVIRDRDPGDTSTQALAGVAAGLMLSDDLQVDAGSEFGLNRQSPDSRIYLGIARRF